jgi:hypothetical protein
MPPTPPQPSEASDAFTLVCAKCITRIKPGQLYVPHGRAEIGGMTVLGPIHVSCPTEREIAHAQRMGRDV